MQVFIDPVSPATISSRRQRPKGVWGWTRNCRAKEKQAQEHECSKYSLAFRVLYISHCVYITVYRHKRPFYISFMIVFCYKKNKQASKTFLTYDCKQARQNKPISDRVIFQRFYVLLYRHGRHPIRAYVRYNKICIKQTICGSQLL